MSEVKKIVEDAQRDFGVETEHRGDKNEFYFNTLSVLSEGRLPYEYGEDSRSDFVDPIFFLTGKKSGISLLNEKNIISAPPPFVALIAGQYGLGKTELVFRISQSLSKEAAVNPDAVQPYPINLANCRDVVDKLAENITGTSFARLFFPRGNRLSEEEIANLRESICQGKIFLILDGLDELTINPLSHRHFFSHLTSFLNNGQASENLKFRVAVTVRLEYLQMGSIGEDAYALKSEWLAWPGEKNLSFPVYFLKLDFLDDTRVVAYLMSRLNLDDELLKRIRSNERLFETLRRPLLLRIFCDCIQNRPEKITDFLDSPDIQEHTVKLIETFVQIAAEDEKLQTDQETLTPKFSWRADKLAEKSLELYRESRREMRLEDIRQLLGPPEMEQEIILAGEDEVLAGIHKCPFLKSEIEDTENGSQTVVRFSHNMFLEYFTAQGMAKEIEGSRAGDKFDDFDELVLNIDMRKLLRGLLGDEIWFSRTEKSYALSSECIDEWERSGQIDFDKLNADRKELLDSMTEPEKYLKGRQNEKNREVLSRIVTEFLTNEKKYHPRYLLYNYEAVAICISLRLINEVKESSKSFEVILKQRMDDTIENLKNTEVKLCSPLELLLERVISIGQRLRYRWIGEYAGKKSEILNLIKDPNTRATD